MEETNEDNIQVKTLKQTLSENADLLALSNSSLNKPSKNKTIRKNKLKVFIIFGIILALIVTSLSLFTLTRAQTPTPEASKTSSAINDSEKINQSEAVAILKEASKKSMETFASKGGKAEYKTFAAEQAVEKKTTLLYSPVVNSTFYVTYITGHTSEATSGFFEKNDDIFGISNIDFNNYVSATKKDDTITLYNDNKVHSYTVKIKDGLIVSAQRSKPMGTPILYKDSYTYLNVTYSLTPEEDAIILAKIPQ